MPVVKQIMENYLRLKQGQLYAGDAAWAELLKKPDYRTRYPLEKRNGDTLVFGDLIHLSIPFSTNF